MKDAAYFTCPLVLFCFAINFAILLMIVCLAELSLKLYFVSSNLLFQMLLPTRCCLLLLLLQYISFFLPQDASTVCVAA